MSPDPTAFTDALSRVLSGPAALHEPEIRGNEWTYVKECLDTQWVSSVGKYVDRFEDMLAQVTGARHAVVTVNGTAAHHAALLLAGVEAGDEVIVPALTFIATTNAVSYCGAIPHFADSEMTTLGLDPAKLADYLADVAQAGPDGCVNRLTNRRIAAVVCMHTFGHPVDLDPLVAVCRRHGLPLVEDAAESLGTTYRGIHTGNHGLLSTLSFNGNKVVTTGGGGAILTNDDALGKAAKHLTTTAKTPHRWLFDHDKVGFNYRLPNINAAVGCAQLEQLPGFLSRKRDLAEQYRAAFEDVRGLRFFKEPAFGVSNYWLNAVLVEDGGKVARDALLAAANDAGFMCRPAWTPMHRLPMYADCPHMDLSVAEDLFRRLINIPSSPHLAGDGHAP